MLITQSSASLRAHSLENTYTATVMAEHRLSAATSHAYTHSEARVYLRPVAQSVNPYMTVSGSVCKLLVLRYSMSHTLVTKPRAAPGHSGIMLLIVSNSGVMGCHMSFHGNTTVIEMFFLFISCNRLDRLNIFSSSG